MAQPILLGMVYGSIRTTYTILTLRLLDSDVASSNVYTCVAYVLVITCLRGMLLVYGHETRGRVAPEGGVSINRNIPIRHDL